jgi:hypothetical protein
MFIPPRLIQQPDTTECPTRYGNWHFFNNSNINEDIATKFEQECVVFFYISFFFKFRCNILASGKIIKEMPGSVASGTLCITVEESICMAIYCRWQ